MSTRDLKHDYLGLSEVPSIETSGKTKTIGNQERLNLKATELRLGLPGSELPGRSEPGFLALKSYAVSGAKRVFSDAINGSGKWVFSSGSSTGNGVPGSDSVVVRQGGADGNVNQLGEPDGPAGEKNAPGAHGVAPASKTQVVGWPPIRSFRKNTMSSQSQNNDNDSQAKPGSGHCLYLKVSMDGAPYLRKIDLNTYKSYMELSSGLQNMFGCFTIGQCGSHGGRDGLNESRLTDLLKGSEYVLTYEDKDGDWMLVGDVPWKMFTDTCKRLRIMKSSEAIGLAPRAIEKCKSQNK